MEIETLGGYLRLNEVIKVGPKSGRISSFIRGGRETSLSLFQRAHREHTGAFEERAASCLQVGEAALPRKQTLPDFVDFTASKSVRK